MPKQIEFDGKIHEFPDDFTDSDIQKALASESAPAPRSVSGFAGNIVESGARLIGDTVAAITSPIQTAKAIGGLGAGLVEKVIPGEQGHEQNVDALVKMYVDRYGGIENIKKTVYDDPVGFLADIATLAGGVGAAAKGAELVTGAVKAGEVAKAAGTLARNLDPVNLAIRPLAKVAQVGGLPEKIYQSALKPRPGSNTTAQVERMVQTGLEQRIPVSKGGIEKLNNLISDLQTAISGKTTTAAQQGVTVNKYKVASRLDDTAKTFSSANQVNPEKDLATISEVGKEFLRNQPDNIPADRMQAVKVGTYKQLRKKYGQMGNAEVEAQKALARGAKEELASAIPELSTLNGAESDALGLSKELQRAVGRIDNHDILGIGTPLAAEGIEAATGSNKLAAAGGIMRAIVDNPNVKSRLAIAIHYAQKKNPARFGRPSLASATSRAQEYIDSLATALERQTAQPAIAGNQ